uniref:Carboxylic ester hydrolase n=1 Tax=Coturnix japonica TaxID=93934 RepID=A0A8C2TAW0_COTJA
VPAGPPGVMAAAFLGIPYAIPPIGSLRFRPPVPITTPWGGVRDTDTQPYACYQMIDTTFPGFEGSEMWNPNREMNEDCLYLNVWTPKRKPYKAPVLVWVYGGGFYSGSVSLDVYDGRYLAVAEDAIVISMNYRVGSIGFLALVGYRDAPGNVGLWDQRLALQWIRVNAEAFGGDPNRVTLFGESAGAASIGLHLLSPYSKGLFNRAVLQSGSPNGPWATIGAAEGRRRAALLGKAVGCPYGNETELVGCLKGVDALRLVEGEGEVLPPQSVFRFAFVPVVDGEFLIDSPEVMLGAVEVLLGAVRDEGSYFLVYGVPGFGKDNESLISREEFLGGVRMGVPQANDLAAEAVVLHYTDWLDADNPIKNREALDDIVGDHNVVCPMMAFAQRWAQRGGKVYAYLFDHRASTLLWPSWMGVPHGYEIEFVFGQPLDPKKNYTKEEQELSRRIMRYWGNFARTGDPNGGVAGPQWPPYTPSGQRYAHLNARPLSVGQGLRTQICAFWTRFLPKLLNATGPTEDAEREWRLEFHRWSSYMGRWRTQFEHYSRQQPCATL